MSDVDWEATQKKWKTKRNASYNKVLKESLFVLDLMHRLHDDISSARDCQNEENDCWSQIRYKTRFASECRRIRRELLKVAKMLDES